MIVAPLLAAAAMAATPVRVEVQLDAAGKVTDCAMLEGPLQGSDSRPVCMAMLRGARFEPGRDDAGNPVPSKTETTVRMRMRAATVAELASAEARSPARAAPPAGPASAR